MQSVSAATEPIHCGLDFNVNNMSAVIAVRLDNKLVVIDEVSGSKDTDALAQEIQRRYDGRKTYIYPDASGGNRSTNASRTDIQILESMDSAINLPVLILQYVIGWLLFKLCWRMGKEKSGSKSGKLQAAD